MRILFDSVAHRKLKKIHKRYLNVGKLLNEAFDLYLRDPRSPSLRLHKLKNLNLWSISLKPDLRVIFKLSDEQISIVDIGSHDEVYR